ncbi:MAG: hypothetical protein L0Z62_50985 [Gemmataceae bacterium]|nr:hypothetical protein [Gemmataceae bacterium]
MATVLMTRYELAERGLPRVCMRCGTAATMERKKTFAWHPPWVFILLLAGLLPFAIVAIVLTKRMTVYAPLCEAHRNHWRWRAWFIWLGLTVVVALGIAAMIVLSNEPNPRRGAGQLIGGLLCAGSALGGVIWLIATVIVQQMAIRPKEILDDSILLANIAPAFEEALWDKRAQHSKELPYERRFHRPYPDDGSYREEERL